MGDRSNIGWTDTTLNIASGCTRVSDGCLNCYIDRTAPFRIEGRRFDGPGIGATTGVALHPKRLRAPLRWTRPRRIFINSLADLWHDEIPDELIARLWIVMAMAEQHRFQLLTKRPARMRALLTSPAWPQLLADALPWVIENVDARMPAARVDAAWAWLRARERPGDLVEPLPNVLIGVSVESQDVTYRIRDLLRTPAALRWLSCEPLIGPLDLRPWLPQLDWLVIGGETGPAPRPMHPDWARGIRDQAVAAGVEVYFKQWGVWGPAPWALPREPGESDAAYRARSDAGAATHTVSIEGHLHEPPHRPWSIERGTIPAESTHEPIRRWGVKAAGRELDGHVWDDDPALRSIRAGERVRAGVGV